MSEGSQLRRRRLLASTLTELKAMAAAASHGHRVVFLLDGHVVDDLAEPTTDSVAHRLAALEG